MNDSCQYKALIFDCDGTLADSMPAHYRTWKETLARHGIPLTRERFYALGGVPATEVVRILAEEAGVAVDYSGVGREKDELFLKKAGPIKSIPAVADVARRNRGEVPMAVATGNVRALATATLDRIGMADWFDTLVTSEDVERGKPHPDIFLEAARRLGVAPADCLVFEDSDLGISAARRAGMDYVDVRELT